jgi:hypothetical protein
MTRFHRFAPGRDSTDCCRRFASAWAAAQNPPETADGDTQYQLAELHWEQPRLQNFDNW